MEKGAKVLRNDAEKLRIASKLSGFILLDSERLRAGSEGVHLLGGMPHTSQTCPYFRPGKARILPMPEDNGTDYPPLGGVLMRVLIVDDDADTLELFSTLLKMWDHEVRVLSKPALALSAALEFLPEVVFLDVSMPEIDGCAVARRMRQHKALDSAFLVAVTGHGRDQDREMTHAAGFDVHLLKPVDVRDLQLILKKRPYPAPRQRSSEPKTFKAAR